MRARGSAGVLAAALLLAGAAGAGEVRGRVSVELGGLELDDVAPVVVYLEALRGETAWEEPAAAVLRQRHATFQPGFLVVARGQTVEMPNEDTIFHNVFSFSAPNDFDLGLYAAGRSRSVTFEHAGPVRLYCSIHESMNATVFVAPTPWFAQVDAEGRFAIRDVPEGRWRLRTWSEKLPPLERPLEVDGRPVAVELRLASPP